MARVRPHGRLVVGRPIQPQLNPCKSKGFSPFDLTHTFKYTGVCIDMCMSESTDTTGEWVVMLAEVKRINYNDQRIFVRKSSSTENMEEIPKMVDHYQQIFSEELFENPYNIIVQYRKGETSKHTERMKEMVNNHQTFKDKINEDN